MACLHNLPHSLQHSLVKRSCLKVIAGLNNFDSISVKSLAKAAGKSGADLLDIACDPDLVRLAIQSSGLPVCVSAVNPELFPVAVDAGASMVEIGNFDTFYPQGRIFGSSEVLELTLQTRKLLPNVVLSVTVPHILSLNEQSQLAIDLIAAGADIIQTEGGTSSKAMSPGTLGLIEKAAPTLAAVHSIAETFKQIGCSAPLMCASGLTAITAPMAFSVGASGVGVGSAVNRLSDELAIFAGIRALREEIDSSRNLQLQTISSPNSH